MDYGLEIKKWNKELENITIMACLPEEHRIYAQSRGGRQLPASAQEATNFIKRHDLPKRICTLILSHCEICIPIDYNLPANLVVNYFEQAHLIRSLTPESLAESQRNIELEYKNFEQKVRPYYEEQEEPCK